MDPQEQRLLALVEGALAQDDLASAAITLFEGVRSGAQLTERAWVPIWDRLEHTAATYLPSSVLADISERIARVPRVDDAVFKLTLPEDARITFLLGAGASKPAPSGLPTVAELLPELWRRAAKLGREDLDNLAQWCGRSSINNIEDLLTAAYIAHFATRNVGVLSLLQFFLFRRQTESVESRSAVHARRPATRGEPDGRRPQGDVAAMAFLQDTLQNLLGLLMGPMISAHANQGHEAIATLARKHKNVSIITTNYDGCIDQALSNAGVPYDYLVDRALERPPDPQRPTLIKMHGSINWCWCDSCQEMKVYELSFLRSSYDEDRLGFPVISICRNCEGQSRPMIVPPMSFKFVMFPPLLVLWDEAQRAFSDSRIIVSVGYSFSEADTYITKMISRAMSSDRKKWLVVVDTNPRLADSLRTRLGALIDNFDGSRVITACESTEVFLPRFRDSLLAAEAKAPASPRRSRRAASKASPP